MICQLLPSEEYKYLGIIEWRVRKLLCTKLTNRNLILAVNMYCVSLLCYSGGIVSWSQADLYKLDEMTRKQFTMHGEFSRNSNIDSFYVPRKLGGRGLVSVNYAIEHEKGSLATYVYHSCTCLL